MTAPTPPDAAAPKVRETPPPIRYREMAPAFPEGERIEVGSLFAPAEGPIELEIGYGRGRFSLERARAVPDTRVLGIEIKNKLAYWVATRGAREGLTNLRAFAGDARLILPRLGPDGVLERVFVHFPDPWWKKKHAKRRVVDDDFLVQVARLVRVGGELFAQTDVEERAHEMRAYIESATGAEGPLFAVRPGYDDPNPYRARSNREVRADEDGLPVYRIFATRR